VRSIGRPPRLCCSGSRSNTDDVFRGANLAMRDAPSSPGDVFVGSLLAIRPGSRQRPRPAALSGSHRKAPGSARGYLLFPLDGSGHVCAPPVALDCEDDATAIDKAKNIISVWTVEVWLLERFVARITPTGKVTPGESTATRCEAVNWT